jgi:large subunit ribosomal protein L4e
MDKVNIYDLDGKKKGIVDLPKIFSFKPRIDVIRKAIEVSFSRTKQIQGRDKRAGLRVTALSWGTGHGMSRAPRISGSGFPTARNVGRVPYAKGGRRTHPIKTEKRITKKLNKKTYKLALISAISASGNRDWVKNRGHIIDNLPEIPLVIDDKIQTIKKTALIHSILSDLGLKEDLLKVQNTKKIRAGKGKRRGRKYKLKKSLLIVIKDDFGLVKASRNIPGVDITKFENLSIENLAPGGNPGRLILWVQSAFNELKNYEEVI